ncbi:MAG: hypothetical protein IAF38_16175 [Bacteroidia bacterium]|nr:hypothetical protein [Bacteroidia bacterium]
MKLKMYDPPGFMTDFDKIPGQLEQWSNAISGWINGSIQSEVKKFKDAGFPNATVQFFNATEQDLKGLSLDQDIIWNAFPRTLILGYGGKQFAYPLTEKLFSLTAPRPGLPTAPPFYTDPKGSDMWSKLVYRPLDEYCEWRVERDPTTKKIIRVTFTSEPPEYWQALHGDELQDVNGKFAYKFTGDRKLMLDLYHQYISPKVKLEDLQCKHEYYYYQGKQKVVVFRKGDYNPYNPWNSTKGIMHLAHPNNFIAAEIQLGSDATVMRQKNGIPVVQADALICCGGYGGTSRNSDPTIGASVNDLARLGAMITLKNPVGLYIHDLNTEGFTKPNGEVVDPKEYFKVLRGNEKEGMIERAVFEVPASEGFTVGDIKIGGVPIKWGGQIADHINIKITGTAVGLGSIKNPMLPCATYCCINETKPLALTRVIDVGDKQPAGYQKAFLFEQGTFGNTAETLKPKSLLKTKAKKTAKSKPEKSTVPPHKKR